MGRWGWEWWVAIAGLVTILYGLVVSSSATDYSSAGTGLIILMVGCIVLIVGIAMGGLVSSWRKAESILSQTNRILPVYYPVQPIQPAYYAPQPAQPLGYQGGMLSARIAFCPYCGKPADGAVYCAHCGKKLPE